MSVHNRPLHMHSALGAKLRHMREQADLTLEEAAAKLDKSRSSLRRRETGVTKTDVHLARSMMDLYNIPDTDVLDEIRKAARQPRQRQSSP